jgi:cytochrome c biogenesis protein
MKSFREHVSEQSLNAFKHRHEASTAQQPEALAASAQRYLEGQGYKVKSLPRAGGVLLAAKAGSWNRLGYFLAHSAIVLICIGGLMDGNLVFKVQQGLGTKKIETRDIPQARCRRSRAVAIQSIVSRQCADSRLQRRRGFP